MTAPISVRSTAEPHIAEILIDRPDHENTLTAQMAADICRALTALEQDDDVKVIVLSAAGDHLSAGIDVAEIIDRFRPASGATKLRPLSQRARFAASDVWWGPAGLFSRLLHCPKVTIAAAKGKCFETGLYFALYCDLTVASATACFANPAWRQIGVNGDVSMLVAAVGLKRAKEMIYAGACWDAATALSYGLVDAVADPADHARAVAGLARTCAMIMRDAIAAEKHTVAASLARMQISTGLAAGAVVGGWVTNIHFREDEFNLLAESRRNGLDEARRAGRRFMDGHS